MMCRFCYVRPAKIALDYSCHAEPSGGFFIEGPGAKKLCAVGQAAKNAIDMPAENKFVPYQ